MVVLLEAGLYRPDVDVEPFGHPVHGDTCGAAGGQRRGNRGGGLGPGLFRSSVVLPYLADVLLDVGVVWLLSAQGWGVTSCPPGW